MPQQLTTELPPAPEPAWKTAHELRLTWTAPMGGAITVRASYTVPPAVFDKIVLECGFSSDVRSRLYMLLVEGQEFRPPATWRSKQIREYFNHRILFFAPGNVRAVAAGLERQAAAEARRIAENNARIAAAREAQERAAQEALVAVAQAAAIAVVSEPRTLTADELAAELDIPF